MSAASTTAGLIVSGLLLSGCAGVDHESESPTDAAQWRDLFDGHGMGAWRSTEFGGEGEIRIENGVMLLDPGSPLTGITWNGEFPRSDYEILVRCARIDGDDFFCALTVPVGESYCSLVVGGWGGELVGISCIDGMDASQHGASQQMRFEEGRYYDIRMHVTLDRLQAWIDDREILSLDVSDSELTVRYEVEPSKPMGIATYETMGGIRAVRVRPLHADGRRLEKPGR